jgi:hypothetical protein
MKIGKRQQQGREGTKKQKTPCPLCNEYYLETFWNSKMQRKGLYCPSETCSYCKKD